MDPNLVAPPDPTQAPADRYAQLVGAIQGAQQAGGSSPLGSFPELDRLYQATAGLPESSQRVAGDAYNAGVQVVNAEAAAKAEEKRRQDMNDPSKYQQVPKDDGGYAFLDPSGKEISAFEYARITQQDPAKVLADSQNPIDMGFVQDYNNLQDFMNALRGGDTESVDAALKENPELGNYKNDLPGLIEKFKQHYPTVFGRTGDGNQPVNRTYVPTLKVAKAKNEFNLGDEGL